MSRKQQQLFGSVTKVLVARDPKSHLSEPVQKIFFDSHDGIVGDRHWGSSFLGVRDQAALKFGLTKGLPTLNMRQWSAISAEEMTDLSVDLGIKNISRGILGENLVISGIPNFTKLPPGTQLFFKSPSGDLRSTILFVTAENKPCSTVANEVYKATADHTAGRDFVKKAMGHRGLVGIIVAGGIVKEGDIVMVAIPAQKIY